MDYLMNESITAYEGYFNSVANSLSEQRKDANSVSSPELVAKVIYEAATDQPSQLRYIAGEDAHFILNMRKEASDEQLMNHIAKQF
jgi:hypothetical protein